MSYNEEKKYDEINKQSEVIKTKKEILFKTLLSFWKEIAIDESEGIENLRILIAELSKISIKNSNFKPKTTPALKKLLTSVGKLDVSRKSSKAFNEALAEAGSLIQWYPNNVYEDANTAKKLDNYCANLVGKKRDTQNNPCLFYSDDIIVGLFLLGPNRLYPEHAHPASEMWVILSGTAQWKRGSEEWKTKKPGEYFIHTENQAHAMKTMDEPIFALWAWTGDLEKWAKWVEKDENE